MMPELVSFELREKMVRDLVARGYSLSVWMSGGDCFCPCSRDAPDILSWFLDRRAYAIEVFSPRGHSLTSIFVHKGLKPVLSDKSPRSRWLRQYVQKLH